MTHHLLFVPQCLDPLRLEFAGAVYHVTSRGHTREAMATDDRNHTTFPVTLAQAFDRRNGLRTHICDCKT